MEAPEAVPPHSTCTEDTMAAASGQTGQWTPEHSCPWLGGRTCWADRTESKPQSLISKRRHFPAHTFPTPGLQ